MKFAFAFAFAFFASSVAALSTVASKAKRFAKPVSYERVLETLS